MHTLDGIGSLWVLRCNCCWYQHGDKSLRLVAHTEIERSNIHNRYVCTLCRPWICIVFYNSMVYDILLAGSSLTTKVDHWTILWAGIIFYWPSSINFPMQNLIQNSCIVIFLFHFQYLHTSFLCSWNCVCKFLSHSSITSPFLFFLNIVISTAVWEDDLLSSLLFSGSICFCDPYESMVLSYRIL